MQPRRPAICEYLSFLFLSYCVVPNEVQLTKRTPNTFTTEYQWSYVNFSWSSPDEYKDAIYSKRYIPENNVLAGIKFYNKNMYLALPRIRPGTPVTLAQVSTQTPYKTNPLLRPYPSWSMNAQSNCATLQNVHSMEIDRRGIMWVLDGTRINTVTSCPPKLVLLDINARGRVIQMYVFRDEISLRQGGFLNDLVLDESDGGYAYITDHSTMDPGLVVFSRRHGKAWKLRDKSMFAEFGGTNFTVDGVKVTTLNPIDGIALSPLPKAKNEERLVYYTALNAKTIYAISTRILKNEAFTRSDQWRKYVTFVGRKTATSDGLIIDNQGNMFFGLISEYAIGKWNIYEDFITAQRIDVNRKELIWPDSFAMDSSGNLYVITNGINKFFDPTIAILPSNEIRFRIMKLFTGNKSYMFPA